MIIMIIMTVGEGKGGGGQVSWLTHRHRLRHWSDLAREHLLNFPHRSHAGDHDDMDDMVAGDHDDMWTWLMVWSTGVSCASAP